MLVATSRGLVIFDGRMKQSLFNREKSGIVDDAVAHVSIAASSHGGNDAAILLATAGGLSEIAGGRARSITAFHGLASNHLYTSAVAGSRLYAGTLAGLVELEGLRVVRTYKTSNSGLSHDWVTALGEADGKLYIGTNGGGIDALLPTGEWVSFADEVGRFEVNQNAIRIDGERIYVGTADRGLLIYNTGARRWTRITSGLPSQNVTAIVSDERFIYAGTLNGLIRIEKRVIE
jgi:ligand-binding sensor domain-containing protein